MSDSDQENHFRTRLMGRLSELEQQNAVNVDSRDAVVLDQSSVGRISRMDALQQQAMAQATRRKRDIEVRAIHAALRRLDEGEYGYCDSCGEEIPTARLDLNPTAVRCVACIRGD